jgi:hypothetical protein
MIRKLRTIVPWLIIALCVAGCVVTSFVKFMVFFPHRRIMIIGVVGSIVVGGQPGTGPAGATTVFLSRKLEAADRDGALTLMGYSSHSPHARDDFALLGLGWQSPAKAPGRYTLLYLPLWPPMFLAGGWIIFRRRRAQKPAKGFEVLSPKEEA